jgi:hypothetical protein
MEQGEVRGNAVALRRIVAPPKVIEPGEIALPEFGRDDQR